MRTFGKANSKKLLVPYLIVGNLVAGQSFAKDYDFVITKPREALCQQQIATGAKVFAVQCNISNYLVNKQNGTLIKCGAYLRGLADVVNQKFILKSNLITCNSLIVPDDKSKVSQYSFQTYRDDLSVDDPKWQKNNYPESYWRTSDNSLEVCYVVPFPNADTVFPVQNGKPVNCVSTPLP